MPAKSPYSTYSLGTTTIRSDRPTVEKLKATARAKDITVVQLLRILADQEGNIQGKLVPGQADLVKSKDISTICTQVMDIVRVLPMEDIRARAFTLEVADLIEFEDVEGAKELLAVVKSELKAVVEADKAKTAGQLILKVASPL